MINQLTDQIELWALKGENIVLFVDANENLNKKGHLQRLLTGDKCNLIDPVRALYHNTRPPPNTTGTDHIQLIVCLSLESFVTYTKAAG